MPTVVLLGTLDTKGLEYGYLRERLREQGVDTILIDAGINAPLIEPDVSREQVARAADTDVAELAAAGDRGAAVATMARGATELLLRLHCEGRVGGVVVLGGSGGSALVTEAMRALPVGVPKLMVSTVASGDTRPYVGAVDVTMMYSVVDIAGINRISERILTNAAGAIAGMAGAAPPASEHARPLVGATMFGVTNAAVTRARARLEELGYEVLVFHATGTGGQSMEALARAGFLAGVLDLTTTELADEVGGGGLLLPPAPIPSTTEIGNPPLL
ncbi:MAG: Tm-1-like ATP-binding domain-containing protein, partial [Gaiellaceae bacterium]